MQRPNARLRGASHRVGRWGALLGGTSALLAIGASPALAAPILSGIPIAGVENSPFTGSVATLTDAPVTGACPAANYSATVAWANGTTSAGTIGAGTLTSAGCVYLVGTNHSFGEERIEPETVSVTAAGLGGSSTASVTATIADAPITLANAQLAGTAGAALSATVATFTDPDPAAPAGNYTATVDWGDGTTPTDATTALNPTGPSGSYTVTASHTYARAGRFVTMSTVRDRGGSVGSASGPVSVAPEALPAAPALGAPIGPTPPVPATPPTIRVSAPKLSGARSMSLQLTCPAPASRCLGVARVVTLPTHARKLPLRDGTILGSTLFILGPGVTRTVEISVATGLRAILRHAHSVRLAGLAIAFAAHGRSTVVTGPTAVILTARLR